MSQARQELAMRRQQLVARSSAIRAQMVVQSTAFGPWLALGDQVRAGFLWMRRHPGVVIAVSLAVVVARPRVAWRWGWRTWSAVRLVRSVSNRLAAWERR